MHCSPLIVPLPRQNTSHVLCTGIRHCSASSANDLRLRRAARPADSPLGMEIEIYHLACVRPDACIRIRKMILTDVDISDPSAKPPLNLVYAVF
jgi:hypothetical protein